MLACDNVVTLIHHEKTEDDLYICTTYTGASWFEKTTISTSGDGVKPANTYEVRIMGTTDIPAAHGDYIARGVVEKVEKPSDLKGLDCFRITSIGDNRRGTLAHWRFSGQ